MTRTSGAPTPLRHYHVEADNGDVGRVDDLLVDPNTWALRYVGVEKGDPLLVNRLLVPLEAVHRISWDTKRVRVAPGSTPNSGPAVSRDSTC